MINPVPSGACVKPPIKNANGYWLPSKVKPRMKMVDSSTIYTVPAAVPEPRIGPAGVPKYFSETNGVFWHWPWSKKIKIKIYNKSYK